MRIIVEAYLDNNLGDDIMIKIMVDKFPEHQFFLYSDSTVVQKTFENIKNLSVKNTNQRKKDLKNIDAYIKIGGSIFQIINFKQQVLRIIGILGLMKMRYKGIKIATLGCNFGPYSTKFGIKLTEWELRNNQLVTVRDQFSFKMLTGFRKIDNFFYADDIVYNYNVLKCDRIKSGLGISVYRSLKNEENNYENYQALANIADNYIKRTGKRVSLFAFDSEQENDLSAMHHIFNLSNHKQSIDLVPYIGDSETFINKYKNCERIIAIRFHSAILADLFKVPFLPIPYSNKLMNLLNDRGFTGDIISIENLNMKLDIERVVSNLITGENLFTNFLDNKGNSKEHFDQLAKILK